MNENMRIIDGLLDNLVEEAEKYVRDYSAYYGPPDLLGYKDRIGNIKARIFYEIMKGDMA